MRERTDKLVILGILPFLSMAFGKCSDYDIIQVIK